MKQFFERENLIPRIVTLIVACGLWLYVMSEQNPVIERDLWLSCSSATLPKTWLCLMRPITLS